MALTEDAIHTPVAPYNINRRAISGPSGIVWINDLVTTHADLRAIDLHTDTQILSIAQADLTSVYPICVNPANDTMWGDDLNVNEEFWNRMWRTTIAGVQHKYQSAAGGQHHRRNGCVDSAGNVWFGDFDNNNSFKIHSFVDATLPAMGSAVKTAIAAAPLAKCEYLGNPGCIAGRVYYRSINAHTTGTRGIAWIDISTNVRTQVYSALGNHQPYACLDPEGFIYLADGSTTTGLSHLRKLDANGTNLLSVLAGGSSMNSMIVDRSGHLWTDVAVGATRVIRLYDKDTLAELDSLEVASSHASLWNYDFNENCLLLQNTTLNTSNYQIFTICAAAGEIVVEQPRIFVTT